MNTPAHLLIGAALFAKRDNNKVLTGALLGGLLPDLSLYLMAGVAMVALNIPPQTVFNDLYFSDSWQLVFSVDNSFIVWGIALAIAFKYKSPFFIALTCSALLHLVSDFALHNDDARLHFWPLSDWRFASPLSYWDSNHHAKWVAPIEGLLTAVATWFLITAQYHYAFKVGFVILFLAELFVLRNWLLYF